MVLPLDAQNCQFTDSHVELNTHCKSADNTNSLFNNEWCASTQYEWRFLFSSVTLTPEFSWVIPMPVSDISPSLNSLPFMIFPEVWKFFLWLFPLNIQEFEKRLILQFYIGGILAVGRKFTTCLFCYISLVLEGWYIKCGRVFVSVKISIS